MYQDHPDYKNISNLTFYDFIEWLNDVGLKRDENDNQPCYRTQTDLIFVKGKLGIDNFYKFESLCNDNNTSSVSSLFYNLNLEIPKTIPVTNKSERPISWGTSYDLKTYKRVNKTFMSDFKNFKYQMHEY